MLKFDHNKVGKIGEDLVCRFLQSQGFSIVSRNYRKKWGEIDIIAKRGQKIFFVEVKTVSREKISDFSADINNFRPEDNMHPWKMKRLHRAIETYLAENAVPHETSWQLDLVTVRLGLTDKKAKIERIENIS
jgi:putative endonuclease